jgi:phosphatidylserine decarboxylase
MTIHKEGYPSILLAVLLAVVLIGISQFLLDGLVWDILAYAISGFFLLTMLQFFRSPGRTTVKNDNHIIAPADGKVVAIEEVQEDEFFQEKRLQISVFMSPINVHINRFPCNGTVKYTKYHPGKYLVAWHPKSSTENERTTIVTEDNKGRTVMFRQIAGALARRIVFYCKEEGAAEQGAEFGFIKFGSRVDLLLPTSVDVQVKIGDKVTGGESVIAHFS